MSLKRALEISESGMTAQRQVMELIASNLANINTTQSLQGGPYRRKMAVLTEKPLSFQQIYQSELSKPDGGGVEVGRVVEDPAPPHKIYNPTHPDADAQGFVTLPNVSLSQETVDMAAAMKVYEANTAAFNTTKKMIQESLQIQ